MGLPVLQHYSWRAMAALATLLISTHAGSEVTIGGFVQLDVIRDSDEIGAPCEFITAAIPTDTATSVQGADGATNYCVNASRLNLEALNPTKLGQLKIFVSGDLFGNSLSTAPEPRIREAYAELSKALLGGDLLAGQSWSTFVDIETWPDVIDYEGPGGAIATRQPMLRWSRGVGDTTNVQVALEQPGNGTVQDADLATGWPDLVTSVRWNHGQGYLRLAGILRDIRAGDDNGSTATATGWGLSGSGKLMLPANNQVVFEASFGKGLGGYYNDDPPSGVYNPATSRLELLPLYAYYFGVEHRWNNVLSSSLLYSALRVDNLALQPDGAGEKSAYASLNLIWRPDPSLLFGAELLAGGRRDKSGAEGTNNRLQLSAQFLF